MQHIFLVKNVIFIVFLVVKVSETDVIKSFLLQETIENSFALP